MFILTWAVILSVGATAHTGIIPEPLPFETMALCEAHVESHGERMKDWVRGAANVHWDAQVEVKGTCEPAGKPS